MGLDKIAYTLDIYANMVEKDNCAFLFVTHRISNEIVERFYKLRNETKEFGKTFFLLHLEDNRMLGLNSKYNLTPYIFNTDSLNQLNYEPITDTIIPGSNHFATLQFYLDYPSFKYYWVIEYDVIFTGNWNTFFPVMNSVEADFIASHIERFTDNPNWLWWETLHLDNIILKDYQYIKSFNPIYRISNRALFHLNKLLMNRQNWGHHEVLIPTMLNYLNFKIYDLYGKGEFMLMDGIDFSSFVTNDVNENTIRYRPPIRKEELCLKNKLLHPCKLNFDDESEEQQ